MGPPKDTSHLLAVEMKRMTCRKLQRCVTSLDRLICFRLRLKQIICRGNDMSGERSMMRTLMSPTFPFGVYQVKLAKHYTQEHMSQEGNELWVDHITNQVTLL
uniref:Uncharacterized protein n=1 Tax=Magallana gigas TaxID=29159 RepID=A0A8W8MNL7_MAGGI